MSTLVGSGYNFPFDGVTDDEIKYLVYYLPSVCFQVLLHSQQDKSYDQNQFLSISQSLRSVHFIFAEHDI